MNISFEKKKAIVALYRAGIPEELIIAATGLEKKSVRGIIRWSEGYGREKGALLLDFPVITIKDTEKRAGKNG